MEKFSYRIRAHLGFGLVTYMPIVVMVIVILITGADFGFNLAECFINLPGCLFYLLVGSLMHLAANYPMTLLLILMIFPIPALILAINGLYRRKYRSLNIATLIIAIIGSFFILLLVYLSS